MPHALHLSREIQICEKAHQRGRNQARVLTDDESQWFCRESSSAAAASAKVANGRLANCAWRTDHGFGPTSGCLGQLQNRRQALPYLIYGRVLRDTARVA